MRTSVAYLVTEYPALSHAFIEREVIAVRELGFDVRTFSIRPTSSGAALAPATRAEAARTIKLLGRPVGEYLWAVVRAAAKTPRAALVGLRTSMAAGPMAVRSKVWQVFYYIEAILLLEILRDSGIRHIHVHFANNGAEVARIAVAMGLAHDGPLSGWRWTMSIHGPADFVDVFRADLRRKVASASAIACISEFARSEVRRLAGPVPDGKLSIVRMSVSGEAYPAMGTERLSREDGTLRLLFVGRLVSVKGPDILLEAVANLIARGQGSEAVLIGQGPMEGSLRAQTRRLGLEGAVKFEGPVGQDRLPGWYRWADVFCLPSYSEGVPVVLMEAMSTELPVVSTRVAGIPELVEDGVSGVLIQPGKTEDLVSAIEALASSPALRLQLGKQGRQRVLADFSPRLNAERLVAAIGLE